MKIKKFLSAVLALTISASALPIVSLAATEGTYETIFEDNFDNGITSVIDEGAAAGSQVSASDGAVKFGDGNGSGSETFHILFNGGKSYSVTEEHTLKMTFDVKGITKLARMGVGFGDTTRNNGAFWSFSIMRSDVDSNITNPAKGHLSMGSAMSDAVKLYPLKNANGEMKTAFKASSAKLNGTNIDVEFSSAVTSVESITIGGTAVTGTLSSDDNWYMSASKGTPAANDAPAISDIGSI